MGEYEGYCMKCKKKVAIVNGERIVSKNNRAMVKGKCGICGTTVCRIIPKEKSAEESGITNS